ncbi:[Protein-PII] uridylyltransferase / [Protein-PII]-UMP uridylyl-removing enzyme [hydrothermal vent metagenome]|uniref:[Protein-PII] uridylyltransferase / [Protein-PII]-UMP uridylyl-removing enzyme n=1 Tax=hydrothermal vent metagenome TaxID=652676 RepID=A0A3B0UW54_9ZZZZ
MPDTSQLSELRTRREVLEVLWRRGLSGQALLHEHTQVIDSHLQQQFRQCPAAADMALIAIGGYGRRELFPFSDIDLLLLHGGAGDEALNSAAEAIFYPLWDAGLDVGHSVRTRQQCIGDAAADFFFQVAFLDARLIAGSNKLFQELQSDYQQKFINGQRRNFLEQMTRHREHRLKTFAKHSYLLEPHIKEGRGGLRDIQAIMWTAKTLFGLKDMAAIHEAGILSAAEYKEITKAWEHLIQIRNRLHYLSGRKNDQLFFEHQEEISKQFNYRASTGIRAVEQFMRKVYDNLQTIAVSTDLFFAHVQETIVPPRSAAAEDDKTLESGIFSRRGYIHLGSLEELRRRPILILRLFLQTAKTGLAVHHQTRKLISANLDLLTKIQKSAAAGQTLLDILAADRKPPATLEAMLECGVLAAYLPEFAHLKSLAQHDVYHIFTVDYHLIQTVAALKDIISANHNIFSVIQNPKILFLSALLHDIGKGYGTEHAAKGARLAEETGRRLGLKTGEIETLIFAIRRHLFLPETALRRDLEDSDLIARCAGIVQSTERLAILYLLSIADAMATGPANWNDWKAALLLELYLKIALFLEKSGQEENGFSQGISWIKEQVRKLLKDDAESFDLDSLPDDYLLNFSPEDIVTHLTTSKELDDDNFILQPRDKGAHWSLLIITRDRPGLLTKICGVTALHGLEILAAQVFTWPSGIAVDTIDVCPFYNETFGDLEWADMQADLKKALTFRLGLDYRLNGSPAVSLKKVKIAGAAPKVIIDNATSAAFTIIEIYADKEVGMIYRIAGTLADFRINIFRAKIGTRSDQVVNVFYILDNKGRKITSPDFLEEIRQSLLFAASPQSRPVSSPRS